MWHVHLSTLAWYEAADILSSSMSVHVTIRQYSMRTKGPQFSYLDLCY